MPNWQSDRRNRGKQLTVDGNYLTGYGGLKPVISSFQVIKIPVSTMQPVKHAED